MSQAIIDIYVFKFLILMYWRHLRKKDYMIKRQPKHLEKGTSENPMGLFIKFRGRESIAIPLIKRLVLE
jgi:hypothetical protein